METKIKNLLARLAFFAEDGMAEPPIVAIAKDADALLKEMCMAGQAQAEPRCACGDSFTSDAACANCLATQQQAEPVARDVVYEVLYGLRISTRHQCMEAADKIAALFPAQPPAVAVLGVTNISMETIGGNHRVVLHVGTIGEMYDLGKSLRSILSAAPQPAVLTLNQAQVEALKEVLRISDRSHEAWDILKKALK